MLGAESLRSHAGGAGTQESAKPVNDIKHHRTECHSPDIRGATEVAGDSRIAQSQEGDRDIIDDSRQGEAQDTFIQRQSREKEGGKRVNSFRRRGEFPPTP